MVAGGHDRNAGSQKIDRDFAGDATAAGGVFAIDHDKIDAVLFLEFRQPGDDGIASRLAHDVTEEKNR